MKKIVKKWEGGAKKHGGFGKAMGVQIDRWIQSAGEEQARQDREEEQRQRLELEQRLAKEAEERERLEQEQIRKALELSQKQAEELATQKLAKEAEERERVEQDQIRKALELSQRQAEELEQLKLAEKLSKESFEKSQREKIWDFLSRSQDVSDEAAFPAMDIVKNWESTNTELIEKLRSFEDPVLNSFLDGEVGIVGGDSSF